MIGAGEVRVRGPESGKGPVVLVEPHEGSTLLGYGQRFDPGRPGPLRIAWLVLLHGIGALGGLTLGWIRAAPRIPAALARRVVAVARGGFGAVAVGAKWLVRMAGVAVALLLKQIIRMPRALPGAARGMRRALVVAARGVGIGLVAAVVWVARVVGAVPRAAVVVVRGLGLAVGLAARVSVTGAGRAVRVSVIAVGRAVRVSVAAAGRAVRVSVIAVGRAMAVAVPGVGRAVVESARALVVWSRTVGRGIRGLPRTGRRAVVASVSLLARSPHLVRAGLALAGRVGRALGRLPGLVVWAGRSAASAVGRFARWLRHPQVLMRYVGLPVGLLLVTLGGGSFSAHQKSSGPSTTLTILSFLLAGLALGWLLRRSGHYLAYRTHGGNQSHETTARVLWLRPRQGLRAVLGPGWLAVQPADADADRNGQAVSSLLISLVGDRGFQATSGHRYWFPSAVARRTGRSSCTARDRASWASVGSSARTNSPLRT